MKNHVKKPYEAAELTLIGFPTDDLMTGSAERDEFFLGDLDSFISNTIAL